MSSVVIAGDTSGTVTLAAPAVSGTTTLTLPATTGTFITTTGGVTPSTAGNLLTSNGTAWTSTAPAASGGMTLLGTLTTTSGTSQTLSGLTLTNYKFLQISVNNVSGNASSNTLRMAGLLMYGTTSTAAQGQWGIIQVDLTNSGAFSAGVSYDQTVSAGTTTSTDYGAAGNCGYTTATTSISFDYSAGATFDSGTIKVYGVS